MGILGDKEKYSIMSSHLVGFLLNGRIKAQVAEYSLAVGKTGYTTKIRMVEPRKHHDVIEHGTLLWGAVFDGW